MRNTLAMLVLVVSSHASAQTVEAPVVLGTLAGASDAQPAPGAGLYGTDLGWSFVHDNQLFMLFGDSWHDQNSVCSIAAGRLPTNDDAEARLPLSWGASSLPWPGVPALEYVGQPAQPTQFEPIQVLRDGVSLNMGLDRTPLTGFSDGTRAIGVFESANFTRCNPLDDDDEDSCADPFVCATHIGECQPTVFGIPQLCDAERMVGCSEGQLCVVSGAGYCVDRSSSQFEPAYQVPLEVEFSVPRKDAPTTWESKLTFPTNKFFNMTARTVRSLGDRRHAPDFTPGTGTVLIWGRPGYNSGADRDTGLYLMQHSLPLQEDAAGKFIFEPLYFAGLDNHERPKWSKHQKRAKPLALDGQVGGSPSENVQAINQMAISWLGAPIHKWVMMYGGGNGMTSAWPWLSAAAGGDLPLGAIAVRFADNPWGPWSPPKTHWAPGSPDEPGTPLGPGGVLFHPDCVSQNGVLCAASDPVRPAHALNEQCAPPTEERDAGFFYAANIIDAYTQMNTKGGVDLFWNVSTWNPYRVLLMRTSIQP